MTPACLADALHLILVCAHGRIGEAIEQYGKAVLAEWDEQEAKSTEHGASVIGESYAQCTTEMVICRQR